MKLPSLYLALFFPVILVGEEISEGEKLFALHVKPLFAEKCNACHGDEPDKLKGDFDMRTREAILRGGEYFADEVLIPGKGAESYLYLTTTRTEEDYEMPPKAADALTEQEQWYIRDWITEGAPWPDDERVEQIQEKYAEGVRVTTSKALSDDWQNRRYQPEDLWAYQPLVRPKVPKLDSTGSGSTSNPVVANPVAANPIDLFIGRKLQELDLAPAGEAEPRLLIRRATFDLLGLPPQPAEVNAFLAAWEQDKEKAWIDLIDRLLESPHYGEQWGRHWLDVVRYADSSGYANDYERPNTWRYRDYVIRSFNEDKPYDQFVREQIAGDEITKRKDAEALIATGFLRMGAWEHTGMSVAKVTRQLFLDDVTDSVGQVFLAHALQCAKCHDHKFDPVPTRDFYSMQAIFATTQFAEVETEWLPEENRNGMEQDKSFHLKRIEDNKDRMAMLKERQQFYEAKWFQKRGLSYQSIAEAKKAGLKGDELPEGRLFEKPEEFALGPISKKWSNRFSWEMDRYRPVAFTVYNGKTRKPRGNYGRIDMPKDPMKEGALEQTAILGGGDPFSPTDPVKPGVLSAVPGGLEYEIPETVGGRRTALANWISDPDNTLTARVMMNRVWQYHFGKAIAGNPNNFGATGKKPTHPELLDWLAAEFVEQGWSVKAMHRIIMQSQAYRRSPNHPYPGGVKEKDPQGISYAVFTPRRLAAEELRDSMLFVSGELNREAGGIPIRPDMNMEAALQPRMIMGTFAPSYVPNPRPQQRNRRTIYAHKTRGQRDPFLEVFNQPGPDLSCEFRDTSNVTPQVFTLLNSEESLDRAIAFAARVLEEREGKSDEEVVYRAFKLAYGRAPLEEEVAGAVAHWQAMIEVQEKASFEPRVYPTEITRRANDERTGEPFSFDERLRVYEEYVHDLQPHEVDARTRAFADLCLVLLNSNEFVYVY
ncbi:MAG: PSD1 and planctomycete cytochrome C domain-containing protein [Verrucomicrobiales bacterium]|jgi:mono/diheme cytochrome c family protein|nr:PSD1 and planctomycete cytochrome C domain-containing protein [Verrucomicrobiales bacterium]